MSEISPYISIYFQNNAISSSLFINWKQEKIKVLDPELLLVEIWKPLSQNSQLDEFVSLPAASKGTQITNADPVDHGKTTIQGSGSEATNNSTSRNASVKKKVHLKKFFKEEEEKKNQNTHDDARLTIPEDGRADTVELEELQKQASSKRKVSK